MDVSEYLKFYSELGVSHLKLPGTNGKVRNFTPNPASLDASPALAAADGAGAAGLQVIRDEIGDCRRCKLAGGRRHIVFGSGNPKAELMFVGEAPGQDEDLQGLPFVGRAGQLLTKIIEAIELRRDDVYIANILKCRPPNNRPPEPDEIAACGGFATRQIEQIRPLVIVALGRFAAQTLLNIETPITRMRGRVFDYHGIPLIPTYHPSYLLRNPSAKREVWEDMKAVRARLKELGSSYYR